VHMVPVLVINQVKPNVCASAVWSAAIHVVIMRLLALAFLFLWSMGYSIQRTPCLRRKFAGSVMGGKASAMQGFAAKSMFGKTDNVNNDKQYDGLASPHRKDEAWRLVYCRENRGTVKTCLLCITFPT
jgi:hypothetical protein